MNAKQTATAIKALGLSCVRIDGEFRVNFPARRGASHDREATAYYTDCSADALATAQAMVSRMAAELAD